MTHASTKIEDYCTQAMAGTLPAPAANPTLWNISTVINTTSLIKIGAGTLHAIIIPTSTGEVLNVYDSIASANLMFTWPTSTAGTYLLDVPFTAGLTMFSGSSTYPVTVLWK